MYADTSQPLSRLLPQLHSVREGSQDGLRDAFGSLLPPCIVMEKGEALDAWIRSSGAGMDMATGLQVKFGVNFHVSAVPEYEACLNFMSFALRV